MLYLAVSYDPHDWRLFLDNWKRGLKCALIHNGNEYAVAPVGHSVHAKETYEKGKRLLSLIRYVDQKWIICHAPPPLQFPNQRRSTNFSSKHQEYYFLPLFRDYYTDQKFHNTYRVCCNLWIYGHGVKMGPGPQDPGLPQSLKVGPGTPLTFL